MSLNDLLKSLFGCFFVLASSLHVNAANLVDAHVTMLLINEDGTPAVGATYSGECESKEDDSLFSNSEKIINKLSCSSDADGFCKFQYKTYQISNDSFAVCKKTKGAKINMRDASPSSWGFLPKNNSVDIFVSVTETDGKWDWYGKNPATIERIEDVVKHNNVVYYKNIDFLNSLANSFPDKAFDFYYSKINVKDDDLETNAVFHTQSAHKEQEMQFIRAFLNKKTLRVQYQIYVRKSYYSHGFRGYNLAKFLDNDEPRSVELVRINQDVSCANKLASAGMCLFEEQFAFNLTEEYFNKVASLYKSKGLNSWKFRISSRSGDEINSTLSNAEFFALTNKIKDFNLRKK